MNISPELKSRILEFFYKAEDGLLHSISKHVHHMPYVRMPVLIDGVMDRVRYNVAEKRFDQLEINMVAGDNISRLPFQEEGVEAWVACSDASETVVIPLPRKKELAGAK